MRLTKADATTIEKWIDNKLGPTAVKGQICNLTTNISEASHLTVLRGLPKCRNHLRNFTGRAKSAVHSMSVGVINSVVCANRTLGAENGAECPASRSRIQILKKNGYHHKRKQSLTYKRAKYAGIVRARRIRQFNSNGYGSGVQDPVVRREHSYTG